MNKPLTGKFKHFCREWDLLEIDETCPEFEVCSCYPNKPLDTQELPPLYTTEEDKEVAYEAANEWEFVNVALACRERQLLAALSKVSEQERELLELRAKLAGMDGKIRDVMHTLSVMMEGRAINPDLSAGACFSVLSQLLPAAPYGEEKESR